jgi:hypothetical protein
VGSILVLSLVRQESLDGATVYMTRMPEFPGFSWYFYYCDELDAYGFYDDNTRKEPQPNITVYVPALDRDVELALQGRGNDPYQDILERGYQDRLFPLDLYHEPYQWNPRSSRNMPPWRQTKWNRIIRVAQMDPTQALCDLLVAIKNKDRDTAMDWCEGLFDWLEDEREFPDLEDRRIQAIFQKRVKRGGRADA